jgi:hypothetical protein
MDMLKDKAKNGSDDGSLNELAASIASKLARNAAPLADSQPSVPQEGDSFDERQDANISPSHGAETVLLDKPPRRKSSDEYRRRADACLSWAREASTDDVRLACLALATAWLKAAVREDGDGSDHLPLAPAL